MLRCGQVSHFDNGRHILGKDNLACLLQRGTGDFLTWQLCQLHFDFLAHSVSHALAVGNQNSAGQRIMLCLAQKVCCKIGWISAVIRNNQNFARTGKHININVTDNGFWSQSYEDIAGAGNFFYLRYGCGAKGQRSNRLCAAHFINFGNAD